jgi:hypothetical protein
VSYYDPYPDDEWAAMSGADAIWDAARMKALAEHLDTETARLILGISTFIDTTPRDQAQHSPAAIKAKGRITGHADGCRCPQCNTVLHQLAAHPPETLPPWSQSCTCEARGFAVAEAHEQDCPYRVRTLNERAAAGPGTEPRLDGPHPYKPQNTDPHLPCTCSDPKPGQIGAARFPFAHDQSCPENYGQFSGTPAWRREYAGRAGIGPAPAPHNGWHASLEDCRRSACPGWITWRAPSKEDIGLPFGANPGAKPPPARVNASPATEQVLAKRAAQSSGRPENEGIPLWDAAMHAALAEYSKPLGLPESALPQYGTVPPGCCPGCRLPVPEGQVTCHWCELREAENRRVALATLDKAKAKQPPPPPAKQVHPEGQSPGHRCWRCDQDLRGQRRALQARLALAGVGFVLLVLAVHLQAWLVFPAAACFYILHKSLKG